MELLKIQGWQFFQLNGPYAQSASHSAAFSLFTAKVEEIMQTEVEVFIKEVVKDKKGKPADQGNPGLSDG